HLAAVAGHPDLVDGLPVALDPEALRGLAFEGEAGVETGRASVLDGQLLTKRLPGAETAEVEGLRAVERSGIRAPRLVRIAATSRKAQGNQGADIGRSNT